MAVPFAFANLSGNIALSKLDSNFNTPITIGNTSVQLGGTITTLNNMTLSNVTISGGTNNVTETLANVTTLNATSAFITTGNITTANVGNLTLLNALTVPNGGTGMVSLPANNVLLGNGTSPVASVAPGTVGNVLTSTGTGWVSNAVPGGGGSGTVTSVSVVSANGLAGTVANANTTPAITLSTTVTGLLKGNGTAIGAAIANTDYQSPITLTTAGTSGAATFVGNTLNIPQYTGGGGSGTVTTVSVVSANGLAGTVANANTTPAITLSTSITGVLKGNGTAISAATANTDYQSPITLTTTGTSGNATFIANTLNIPQYSSGGVGASAWVNFNGIPTVSINGSFNVSSITRNSTGNYRVNFTSSFADNNYSIVGMANAYNGNQALTIGIQSQSTSNTNILTGIGNSSAAFEGSITGADSAVCIAVFR